VDIILIYFVWKTKSYAKANGFFFISSLKSVLFRSDNFFESRNPSIALLPSKTTAAAHTLPANGPLPASSIPAIIFLFDITVSFLYKILG
jgi:hypothetical protein